LRIMNKDKEPSHAIQEKHLATGVGATAEKTADPGVIFLPTPSERAPAAAPQEPPRWFVGADRLMAILLLGLGFLLASFLATNTEVWLNLASGRLIAEGNWPPGVDPFSFSTAGLGGEPVTAWYNQSWLYTLVLFKLFQWVGGAGLVVAKALVVVALLVC